MDKALVSEVELERLIPMKRVCEITSWSRTSIYRLIAQNAFPAPIKLGSQRIAFKESEIRAYVASRGSRGQHAGGASLDFVDAAPSQRPLEHRSDRRAPLQRLSDVIVATVARRRSDR
jgi:prophage regulatory protein